MEFHIITAHGSELLLRVVNGVVEIVPPASSGESLYNKSEPTSIKQLDGL
jgi:hypothetical protein